MLVPLACEQEVNIWRPELRGAGLYASGQLAKRILMTSTPPLSWVYAFGKVATEHPSDQHACLA
jgi:hypothetical protein